MNRTLGFPRETQGAIIRQLAEVFCANTILEKAKRVAIVLLSVKQNRSERGAQNGLCTEITHAQSRHGRMFLYTMPLNA